MKYLFILLLASFTLRSAAAPTETPLNPVKDPIGEALQRTFISSPAGAEKKSPFVAYRKKFNFPMVPGRAILHLFADARYLLWINGQPASRGPNRFDPSGPEYDSIEVTRWLKPGENQITVLVMGFSDANASSGGMGNGANARMKHHASGLTARLDFNGRPLVATDPSWKWSSDTRYRLPAVDWAQICDRIDARVESGDWTKPIFDDASWKAAAKINGDQWGPLSARRTPMGRDVPVLPKPDGGKLPATLNAGQQFDFKMDRLVQAYTIIEIEADADTVIRLGYANIDYIARAGRQTYISSDTFAFDGGAIQVKSGKATIRSLQFIERLYPFDIVGNFKSNDESLNRLWAVCARSCQITSEDAYVDCADRERAEWMDTDPPAFDVTRTAMAGPGKDGKPIYADARLLGVMLRRTALSVQPEGWVKAHTCSDRFDIHAKMEDRGCDWVEGARRYYDSTGNPAIIHEIWPVIVRQMDYFLKRRSTRGLVLAREWVVWGNPVGYVTCEGAGLNAFVYKALVDAAYLGNIIGEKSMAAVFSKAAIELAQAFNTVLWDEKTGTYFSGYYSEADRAKAEGRAKEMKLNVENNLIEPTIFSSLWALDQAIVPEARRARVTQYLLDHRQEAARVMTFYYLFTQLYRADTPEFDREVLETMRSKWKGQIESSWQVSWEDFDGGSKAHGYGMFPGYFLSAYVLGVRPDLPTSNKRLIIEPHLGDLTSVEGSVVTEFGLVPVSWKNDNGKIVFRFEVPPAVKGLLRLPVGTLLLDGNAASGKPEGHRFTVEVGPGKHQGTLAPQ